MLFQANTKPEKQEEIWSLFADTVEDIQLELLLLMKADLQGCDLDKNLPDDFEAKLQQLNTWIAGW